MRILFAGSVDLSLDRGDTLHFLQLAKWMGRRGHDVLAIGRGESPIEGFEALPVEAIPNFPGKYTLPLNDVNQLLKLSRIIKTFDPEIIYQREVPVLNRLATRRGILAIVEVNGVASNELALRGVSKPVQRAMQLRQSAVFGGADHAVCVTESVKRSLVQMYAFDEAKISVIANGADTELFRPLPVNACRHQLGLDPDPFTIGFIGAFQPWVDFRALMEAVRLLIDQGLAARLLLVGDGRRELEVRQMISSLDLSDHANLPGRVAHQEVPTWIGASDVAVVPLDYEGRGFEGSPLKLFEYMACGRPVVGTNVPATAEFITEAKAGLLYEVGDAVDLASKLTQLANDQTLRAALGENGYRKALKSHSWDAVAGKVEAIAESLLAERSWS